MLASQPVCAFASRQSLNTGTPRCVVPAFVGEVPPTTLVPYSIAPVVWKVP